MPKEFKDWSRGQDEYLAGVEFTWRRYQALRADWEHEHCEFCWHKFLDPGYSEIHKRVLEDQPDRHSSAGWANVRSSEYPAGRFWVCAECFEDFSGDVAWKQVPGDPDAWPYDTPEPNPRPTSADHVPREG